MLADELNTKVPAFLRWCTPSILPSQVRVNDVYGTDISISCEFLGNLLGNPPTGSFGTLAVEISKAYGSGGSLISVNGSSGSNWVVARYFARADSEIRNEVVTGRKPIVLIARNCHHSVFNSLKAQGVRFRFIESSYLERYEAFLPPSPSQVLKAIVEYSGRDDVTGLIITSPTYEGLPARTSEILRIARSYLPDATVVVDEAWGSHLTFADDADRLPAAALSEGADIVLQSSHKTGGALQQTGLLHYTKDPEFDRERLLTAYREYCTTSPSYHLVASIEAAVMDLRTDGALKINRLVRLTTDLRKRLKGEGLCLEFLSEDLGQIGSEIESGRYDFTKLVASTYRYNTTGLQLSKALEGQHRIIAEKSGLRSILFLATFQLPDDAPEKTAQAWKALLNSQQPTASSPAAVSHPAFAALSEPRYEPYMVSRIANEDTREVPFKNAAGRIAAESIELYPPGIPIVIEGYPIEGGTLDYLLRSKAQGASLVCRDPTLQKVLVLA